MDSIRCPKTTSTMTISRALSQSATRTGEAGAAVGGDPSVGVAVDVVGAAVRPAGSRVGSVATGAWRSRVVDTMPPGLGPSRRADGARGTRRRYDGMNGCPLFRGPDPRGVDIQD